MYDVSRVLIEDDEVCPFDSYGDALHVFVMYLQTRFGRIALINTALVN